MQRRRHHLLLIATALAATTPALRAHGDATHPRRAPKQEQKDWGIAGDARDVRLNDTVRFVAHNTGRVMHEFVIGTKPENEKHAALMVRFPDMEHEEPYMAHVPPGQRGEIVWTFNRPGTFEFACLIAGHYQAGMVGTITVRTS
ncbi:MAG: cupredoxin family protein [Ideonella sp.]|nr:cupredoxin family protein [Ideonella sp.]MCC7456497.1 cupredoxin family protein [Nitrospira sp.]